MIITGWWYTYPSEKYELVSWDHEIPNIWKNRKVPNHQPEQEYNINGSHCIVKSLIPLVAMHQGPTAVSLVTQVLAWSNYGAYIKNICIHML